MYQEIHPESACAQYQISVCYSILAKSEPDSHTFVKADVYRASFKFGVFNAIQSICFDDVTSSYPTVAPTGSGKTVLFELAIIRLLMESGTGARATKCVYMAPTKALCSERFREWTTKFEVLGVKCCELTGDTVQFGKSAWGDAKNATIMYGEKWDSLTRHWRDYGQILSQVQLFMVDEVHILNESRGSTLEVVISRMKTRGTSVRFMMVSATVPNIGDIASWVGSRNKTGPAKIFQFGEEFRPCKLTKFVYGVPRHRNQNDFAFSASLDKHLFPVLQQHSVNKPVLVFVATRRGVLVTAEHLAAEYERASQAKKPLPWSQPRNATSAELASVGIGVHHAGLSMDDRRATEHLYMEKILRLVVATSTLAVGVNLPAHTVVIRGVKMYQTDGYKEYSDLDIVQMMGRAGRPQFDKEGIAIILCETELEAKYRDLVQGKTVLESCLHQNLSEHLNSEVGLGTITDVFTAKEWLYNSFLFQRLQRNPSHYAIGKTTGQSWQERLDEMVLHSVTALKDSELLEYDGDDDSGSLRSTEYGDIMSKVILITTTQLSMLIKRRRRSVLCASSDGQSLQICIPSSNHPVYNRLREHEDIRFKIKKVEKPADKVFLLIQAVLGGIPLNSSDFKSSDSQPPLDALSVFRHVGRIARVVVEVSLVKKYGAQIKFGLELMLLNRRPPFGHEVLACLAELPRYILTITEQAITSRGGKGPVNVEILVECGLASDQASHAPKPKKNKARRGDMTAILTLTSDLDFVDFRRISTKALTASKSFSVTADLTKPSQSIHVYIASESIAGVTVLKMYKPQINATEFPVVNTRPLNSVEADLQGLEDDPNFWYTASDEEDKQEDKPVKDLTKPNGGLLSSSLLDNRC
ncbi:P-loop containing nucleoside triphosphate hydrolase protein [Gloeophyllum trabeum ATCC 11539]|uniref:DNA 3'-5' helicase n=1 Tax=Gloeophyllum trabeum (strain ATCC 11539 / FP-39264 / Madison 617) TaxID=670483 RepID=S7QDM8_GLOTA|nr:P-loop containing nucleoside triphosphate hydrolase protein [Gloeophyllum trabeum ATCC 11539]EPQ57931.1 P-loop containing nucleoside triphosphate hydrolase protein [Gloeophyllum trabeum ATCC 11539]